MIKLNAFITIKPYFKNFLVYRIPLIGEQRSRSQLAKILFDDEIAFAYPYGEYLYFKGNPIETLRRVKEIINQRIIQGKIVLGSTEEPEQLYLTPENKVIIKPIVYSAFEKNLEARGFLVPRRNVKKAIPQIDEINRDRGLIISLTTNVVVLRGIKYMLEIRPSGYGILWLDIYSPPYDLSNMKCMSPKEVKNQGLMDQYYNIAVLKSNIRLELLYNMLEILCGNEKTKMIILNFPDGDIIQLSSELLEPEIIERGW
ncbi:MAG: hypothetical protein DRJ31_10235 [Candidatus Methanomethylicota archaeon]|uniref:Uncharacterized protein n=1 Tax=Thermoproteota archaeon TaxID=2056631 RepID=A0A497EJM0_9CREN|nr:MAG: hypothetical protein DRJ31_10235 [Candidatus Verstraetearchaeota archaeon]